MGDIILSQVVRERVSCKFNTVSIFGHLKQSLSSVPTLHERQHHQFSYRLDDKDLPEPYTCFSPSKPEPPFSTDSVFGPEIVLSSSDPVTRQERFTELRRQNTTVLQTGGAKNPPVGWISHQTSSVKASIMFWNPETDFLFEVDFKWFFSANGILRSDVDFRGIQFQPWMSPSPTFGLVLLVNIIFLLQDISRRIRQRQLENPKPQRVSGASVTRCRCCRQLRGRDYLAVTLILMQLLFPPLSPPLLIFYPLLVPAPLLLMILPLCLITSSLFFVVIKL